MNLCKSNIITFFLFLLLWPCQDAFSFCTSGSQKEILKQQLSQLPLIPKEAYKKIKKAQKLVSFKPVAFLAQQDLEYVAQALAIFNNFKKRDAVGLAIISLLRDIHEQKVTSLGQALRRLKQAKAFQDRSFLGLIENFQQNLLSEVETAVLLSQRFPEEFYDFEKIIGAGKQTRRTTHTKTVVPLTYEIDIELSCCLIEVTNQKEKIASKKKKQIKRFLQEASLVNPEKKPVLLYAPMLPERNLTLEKDRLVEIIGLQKPIEIIRDPENLLRRVSELIEGQP